MNVVVNIEGRDALPAWVLPNVTGWELSPDMLLDRLVNPNYDSLTFPSAFFRHDTSPIPPNQWKGVAIRVRAFSERLKNLDLSTNISREEWEKGSIEILQQCKAYIWVDDFQKWFNKQSYAYVEFKWDDAAEVPVRHPGVTLCLHPQLYPEHELYFEKTESETKAPLDKLDKELRDARIIENGAPTISLRSFIGRLLVEATGDSATLPTFYRLVEEGGLVVYDGVLDKRHDYIRHESYGTKPKIVSQEELLGALRKL
jgi:hypothetical protein